EQQQQTSGLWLATSSPWLVSQYTNWYYGHLWSDSSKKGSHVRLLEAPSAHQRRFQSPAAAAGVISEIQRTLPNWLNCISRQFEDLRRPLPDLGQAAELFRELREMAQHLESAAVATRKLDSGNQAYGFDTVMRKLALEEVANPFDSPLSAPFKPHMDETAKTVMNQPRLPTPASPSATSASRPPRSASSPPARRPWRSPITLRASYKRAPEALPPSGSPFDLLSREAPPAPPVVVEHIRIARAVRRDFCRHGKLDPPQDYTGPHPVAIISKRTQRTRSGSGHAGGPAGSGLFRRPFACGHIRPEPGAGQHRGAATRRERLLWPLRVQAGWPFEPPPLLQRVADSADAPLKPRWLPGGSNSRSGPRVPKQPGIWPTPATCHRPNFERLQQQHSDPIWPLQVLRKAGKPVSAESWQHQTGCPCPRATSASCRISAERLGDEYRSVIFYHNGATRAGDELIRLHLDSIMDNLASLTSASRFGTDRSRRGETRRRSRLLGAVPAQHFHSRRCSTATPCLQKDGELQADRGLRKAALMTDRDLTRRLPVVADSRGPEGPAQRKPDWLSLGQCSTEPQHQSGGQLAALHFRLEARDAAAFFPPCLRCCARPPPPDPRLEASAFGPTLLCLLAPYSTARAGRGAGGRPGRPESRTILPPDVHEPVLRHLAEGLKRRLSKQGVRIRGQQQQPGSGTRRIGCYQATRRLLRICLCTRCDCRTERLQQPIHAETVRTACFTLLSRLNRFSLRATTPAPSYRLVSSFFARLLSRSCRCWEAALRLGDQLLRLHHSRAWEREDGCPHSLVDAPAVNELAGHPEPTATRTPSGGPGRFQPGLPARSWFLRTPWCADLRSIAFEMPPAHELPAALNRSPDLWQLWIDLRHLLPGSHFYLPQSTAVPTVNAMTWMAKCECADQQRAAASCLTGVLRFNIEDRWMKWHDLKLLPKCRCQRQEQLRCPQLRLSCWWSCFRCEFKPGERAIFGVSKEITFVMDKLVEGVRSKTHADLGRIGYFEKGNLFAQCQAAGLRCYCTTQGHPAVDLPQRASRPWDRMAALCLVPSRNAGAGLHGIQLLLPGGCSKAGLSQFPRDRKFIYCGDSTAKKLADVHSRPSRRCFLRQDPAETSRTGRTLLKPLSRSAPGDRRARPRPTSATRSTTCCRYYEKTSVQHIHPAQMQSVRTEKVTRRSVPPPVPASHVKSATETATARAPFADNETWNKEG
uniref:DH domain-containing protein n=1 Tax=Macrostomum lignano TaxID=282301 RepID=A0A1I8F474_9PLAT